MVQGDRKVYVHMMITVQKNTQKYFKQFHSLIIITWLELVKTDTEHGLREHSSACK
jgi:hypothetical protein